jgi:hypothetical protein
VFDLLAVKEQHLVPMQRGTDGLDLRVGETVAQIDPRHLGADVTGHRSEVRYCIGIRWYLGCFDRRGHEVPSVAVDCLFMIGNGDAAGNAAFTM